VALVAFGGGLTWGSALLRWGHIDPPAWHRSLRARIGLLLGETLHRWHGLKERLRRLAQSGVSSIGRLRRRTWVAIHRTLRRRNGEHGLPPK